MRAAVSFRRLLSRAHARRALGFVFGAALLWALGPVEPFVGMLGGAASAQSGASSPALPPRKAPIQNQDRTFTPGADYDTIIERGWISFGVYEDFAPYSWVEDGDFKGVDVELGLLIAEALGVEARFVALTPDETVDDDLRTYVWKGSVVGGDVVNIMLHVPQNREFAYRNELVVLTGKYMIEGLAIAYSRAVYPDSQPTPAYFRFDLVGVENDSLADFYLTSFNRGMLAANVRRFRNYEEAMAALKAGEVAAVVGPRGQLEFGLDDSLAIHEPPMPGLAVGKWTLGVALRMNYRQLAYAVDDAIRAAAEDGRLKAIFAKYGLTYVAPSF